MSHSIPLADFFFLFGPCSVLKIFWISCQDLKIGRFLIKFQISGFSWGKKIWRSGKIGTTFPHGNKWLELSSSSRAPPSLKDAMFASSPCPHMLCNAWPPLYRLVLDSVLEKSPGFFLVDIWSRRFPVELECKGKLETCKRGFPHLLTEFCLHLVGL